MGASNQEPDREQSGPVSERSNWLRAGVLGANDGLVSTAGLVVGVAGATSSASAMFTAGLAGLVAGSLSMAGGEYVSVSSQRDAEQAALEIEQEKLENRPRQELQELAQSYEERGIPPEQAMEVATELMKTDPLRAHAEIELKIDPDELTKPWHAAAASFLAFAIGAGIPTLAILTPSDNLRVVVCVVAVLIGLTLTGLFSARLGNAAIRPAIVRNVAVGSLTMSLTWIVGRLTGGLVS